MKDFSFKYKSLNNNSYLIYEIEKPEEIDRLERRMMSSNKIDGLLDFEYSSYDDVYYFQYNISSKISLKQYLEKCKDYERLITIFINVFKLVLDLEDFMISKEHLLMHEDYVYVELSNMQVYFLCLPIENTLYDNEINSDSLKVFINNIINKLNAEQFENKNLINLFKEYLIKEEFLNIEETIKFLKNMLQDKKNIESRVFKPEYIEKKSNSEKIEYERVIKKIKQDDLDFLIPGQVEKIATNKNPNINANKKLNIKDIFDFQSHKDKKIQKNKRENKNVNLKENTKNKIKDNEENIYKVDENKLSYNDYSKTVIIKNPAEAGKTVLLNALNSGLNKSMPYLIRKKNNEKINITSSLYRIGKDIDYVDYVILDNPTISRAHADIIKINNDYYLQDNNSKNHSYINEMMLSDGQAIKLEHNSKVRLSDELFVFKLF